MNIYRLLKLYSFVYNFLLNISFSDKPKKEQEEEEARPFDIILNILYILTDCLFGDKITDDIFARRSNRETDRRGRFNFHLLENLSSSLRLCI